MSDRRRILVCDDEPQSLHALRVVLHGAGFKVDVTRTAAQALDRSALSLPSAAIIGLAVPDRDGVDLCRRLREWSAMPLIIVSAACDEDEQIRALESGADDYLTKPFRPRELVARLEAKLRRAPPGREEPCELDGLEIDLAARVVRRDGHDVHLTPIEFKLLAVFLQNRGRLMTHNALLQQVWGPAYMDARQTLRAHIANLRGKIEPTDGGRLIHTDHGIGYRLASVRPGMRSTGQRTPEISQVPGRLLSRSSRLAASNVIRLTSSEYHYTPRPDEPGRWTCDRCGGMFELDEQPSPVRRVDPSVGPKAESMDKTSNDSLSEYLRELADGPPRLSDPRDRQGMSDIEGRGMARGRTS